MEINNDHTNARRVHQGTNGGKAYQAKCYQHWASVRFHVELAYLTEKSYAGAARELNRKRVPTMKENSQWYAQTVKDALEHYGAIDSHSSDD
ncbi:hypothetical protein CAG58_00980 [Vibrio sp. V31_P5A7T61]|nr:MULTISPECIES: hypothetical protein [unclassified Vibrio]NAW60543.1 hypothetical protein [Vibrio sp. V31_P5A7T61]NAX00329.1 hypothetical protein [Vibrio sp. V34_P3A8T189]NAX08872.1 hypothetical protein [Vibrio sp. V40_P2S30T141]NAX64095.1 hypothetical protein [Vibrio sp. V32_P6A28T40]